MENIKEQVEKILGDYIEGETSFRAGTVSASAYELRDKIVKVLKEAIQVGVEDALRDLDQATSNIEDAQRTLKEIVED